jgi:N-lysine methyltransferase SETD6
MTTLRPIRAGDEVLNYYGPLPNSELLLRYGYTSLKHALYDAVEIPCALIRQAIIEKLGDRVVLPPDGEMDESYVLERESGGPDESGVINSSATFTEFPEELEDQVAPILAPALGIDIQDRQLDLSEQSQLGRTFIEVMSNAIQARLNQYGTTIAADEELLRAAKPGTRYAKALAVRFGEKCLLQEALDFAAHALDGMEHEGGEQPETRATKKQRTIE